MGTTIWSPLESGILAGRYLNGIPEDSRYHLKHDNAPIDIQPYLDNKKEWDEKLLKLKDIAEKIKLKFDRNSFSICYCES